MVRGLALVALVIGAPVGAQQLASRAEREVLQSRVARAESAATADSQNAGKKAEWLAEASAIRARLRDGDFHTGDRISVQVSGEPTMSGTFTTRAGSVLEIPSMPQINLRGVLRSELHETLTREIGRFIKSPEIQTSTQVQVAVMGSVGKPGFYSIAPDAPITDLLMAAGGPTGNTDFTRSQVMRGPTIIADAKRLQQALTNNSTLDDFGMQTGDQIMVGEKPRRWEKVAAVMGVLTLATGTAALLLRR